MRGRMRAPAARRYDGALWIFSAAMALATDKSEAAVKSGVADIEQCLIGRRVVPCQCRVLVWKTDDHAVVIRGLSKDQFPRSEREDFASELLD